MASLELESIRRAIRDYEPELMPPEQRPPIEAAVAIILYAADTASPELLFIERARREGDPWSGDMAFPGGRREPGDPDLATTAARETLEEVGIELDAPIGRIDDFSGSRNPKVPPLVVAPFVYELGCRPEPKLNYEVSDTVWIPVHWMLDPGSASRRNASFPAFQFDRYLVWGLTYRLLGNFFGVLGTELPSYQGR